MTSIAPRAFRRPVFRRSKGSFSASRLSALTPWIPSLLFACLACSPEPLDPTKSLSETDRAAFEQFVDELRTAYSRGDSQAVEAFIAEDFEHRVLDLARKHILPKGPAEIRRYRVVPYEAAAGPVFSVGDVDYEFTVEPLGWLIFEIDDVSLGMTEVRFVVGRRDGQFRIAGFHVIP